MGMPRDPDARRYYRAGKQRLAEAELILGQVKLPAASVYLAGYAAECLLKSVLVERTPEVERPALLAGMKNEFGHNLARLRAGLVWRGVRVPAGVASALAFLSRLSPELRYDPGPGNANTASRFLAATARVVAWADGNL